MLDKKQLILFILSLMTAVSAYTLYNLLEQRKMATRILRNARFIAETEELKKKYADRSDDDGEAMRAEFLALMDKYGM